MADEAMFMVHAGEVISQEAMVPVPAKPGYVFDLREGGVPVRGVRMPHGMRTSLYFVRPIPHEATLATGLTFTLVYAIPGENSADLSGAPVMMDAVAVPLVSGESHADESAFAGSQPMEGAMPLPSVPGTLVVQELAAPVANLVGTGGTLAPGNLALIRVRRRGEDPGDVNLAEILFIALAVRNT